MLGSAATNSVGLVDRQDQRRRDPDRVGLHCVHQETVGPAGLFDSGGDRCGQLERQPQAATANTDECRMLDSSQPVGEMGADLRHVREQILPLDRVDHRQRCCAGNRIAAERAAVISLGEHLAELTHRDTDSDRQSATEPLRERDHVRPDPLGLMEEPRAGTADAGLNLVKHENGAGRRADLARRPQVTRRAARLRRPLRVAAREIAQLFDR